MFGSTMAVLTLKSLLTDDDITDNRAAISVDPKGSPFNASSLRLKRDANSTLEQPIAHKLSASIPNLGMTLLSDKITPSQGFLVEVIITFILVFTIFACIDSKRKDLGGSFPLTIAFALVVGALFGVSFFYLICIAIYKMCLLNVT